MSVKFDDEQFSLHEQQFVWPNHGNALETAGTRLVRELSRVGWDVPGIEVSFRTSGGGANVFRTVESISGETPEGPFRFGFHNPQGSRGRYNVLTGLGEAIVPPGLEVRYFNDDHTVTAHLYLGDDWKRDGDAFIRNPKVNAKLMRKPREYLSYVGRLDGGVLRHNNDLGREYSPEGEEPISLNTRETIKKVTDFIHEKLIPILAKLPTAPGSEDIDEFGDANLRRLAAVEKVAATGDFPVLYSWIDFNDAYRALGRGLPAQDGSENFVLSGSGYRLVAFGDNPHRAKLHPRAHDGFSYASADPAVRAGQVIHGARDDSLPVEVKLRHLNEIYVVDNAIYDKVRKEQWKKAQEEGRNRFTDAEIAVAVTSVAQTMVPAAEYDGSFEQPTYLIGRQLQSDEARIMRGPILVQIDQDRVRTTLADEESGLKVALCDFTDREYRKLGHWAVNDAIAMAERTADLLLAKVKVVKNHEFPSPPRFDSFLKREDESPEVPEDSAPSGPAP